MRVTSAWILLLLLGALGLAQNSDPAITISGIVKDSVTGRGIAGASISLVAGPSKAEIASFRAQATQGGTANSRAFPQFSNLHAVTGEDGTFTFSLAEPTYATMQVTRSGYLPVNKGLGNDFKSSVAISLVPLGVIEGRVVDLDGEPLAGIVMDLIQPTIIDGRKIYRQLTAVRTDDRGQYRLWNLAPGSAYLRAAGRQTILARANGAPTPPEADHAYPAVYFPNAPDRQSASAIQIQPGQTAHADFALEPQKSYRIRGVIRDVSSFTRLGVRLLRGEDSAGNRASVDTTTGSFVIYDVTPGTYTVQAFANGGKSIAMGELEITIGPQDLSGLEIALSTGVEVRGRIEHTGAPAVQDDTQPELANPTGGLQRNPSHPPIQILLLQPGRFPTTGAQPPATVDEQGNFTFTDMLPGKYALQNVGQSIVSIRSGARDVLADGFELGTSEMEPLIITLSEGGGRIGGTVSGLQAGESATIAVVRAGGNFGVVATTAATCLPNADEARFFVFNLAPGDYTLYAWPATQQVEFRNPEVLRALSASAVTATVSENGDQQVSLKVVPADK
jgi:protocatechuate 3,4-dioxygenase beta subunit